MVTTCHLYPELAMPRLILEALIVAALAAASATVKSIGLIRDDRPDSLYLAASGRPEFASVGKMTGAAAGTGEVVAPRWVVTAAHVVTRRDNGVTTVIPSDSIAFLIHGHSVPVRRIVVHPRYFAADVPSAADPLLRKGFDVALVELADAPDVAPARIDSGIALRGRTAWYVGYGTSGNGLTFYDHQIAAGTRRAGTNVIDSIGAVFADRTIPDFLLVSDFDGPGKEKYNRTGDAEPTDLEIQGAGGDSGGGVFVRDHGSWWLVGIYVTGTFDSDAPKDQGLYGSLSYSVRASRFAEWVKSVIGH
jgi:hypothetical protein